MTLQPSEPAPTVSPTASPRRARAWFWPGFAAGFLLLASLTCVVSVFATGLNRFDIADLGGASAAAWTPPPSTPTLPPADVASPSGEAPLAGVYLPGDRVRNITSSVVNIRATPGYLGKPLQDIVAQAMPGDAVEIVEGPVLADNLTWWRVRLSPGGGALVDGWMAEATASGVQIMGK